MRNRSVLLGLTAEVTTLDVTAVDYGYELEGPPPTFEPGSSRST